MSHSRSFSDEDLKEPIQHAGLLTPDEQKLVEEQQRQLNYSVLLWDKFDVVSEKCRSSKHTARAMAEYLKQLASIHEHHANALTKLAQNTSFIAPLAQEGATIQHAWHAVRQMTVTTADMHHQMAQGIHDQGVVPLTNLRTDLRAVRTKMMSNVQQAKTNLSQAESQLESAQKLQAKLQQKLAHKPDNAKLRAQVEQSADDLMMAQAECFRRRNQSFQKQAISLEQYQQRQLQHVVRVRSALLNVVDVQHSAHTAMVGVHDEPLKQINRIDEYRDTVEFVSVNASEKPCPWIQDTSSMRKAKSKSRLKLRVPSLIGGDAAVEKAVAAAAAASASASASASSAHHHHGGMSSILPGAGDTLTIQEGKQDDTPSLAQAADLLRQEQMVDADHSKHRQLDLSNLPHPPGAVKIHRQSFFSSDSKLPSAAPIPMGPSAAASMASSPVDRGAAAADDNDEMPLNLPPPRRFPNLDPTNGWNVAAADWSLAAYEAALCFCGGVRSSWRDEDQKNTFCEIMRVQVDLTEQHFCDVTTGLRAPLQRRQGAYNLVGAPNHTIAFPYAQNAPLPANEARMINYRMCMIRCAVPSDFSSGDEYLGWLGRQLAVLLSAAQWHLASSKLTHVDLDVVSADGKYSTSTETLEVKDVYTRLTRLCTTCKQTIDQLVVNQQDSGAATTPATIQSMMSNIGLAISPFDSAFTSIARSVAAASANSQSSVVLPYPSALSHLMYADLVQICLVVPLDELIPDDDSALDEEFAKFHVFWQRIIKNVFALRKRFHVTESYHHLCMIRLIMEVLGEHAKSCGKFKFDSLICFQSLVEDPVLLQVLKISAESLQKEHYVAAVEEHLINWIFDSLTELLRDFHKADYDASGAAMAAYVHTMEYSGTDATLVYKLASKAMQHSARSLYWSLRDDFLKAEPMLTEWDAATWRRFGTAVCGIIDSDRAYFSQFASLGPFAVESLVVLCALFTDDINIYLAMRESQVDGNKGAMNSELLTALQMIKHVRAHAFAPDRDMSASQKQMIKANLNDMQNICYTLMMRFFTQLTTNVDRMRARCISLDSWTPISEAVPCSSSAVDFFAILSSATETYKSYLQPMFPYGFDSVHDLVQLVGAASSNYAKSVLISCGDVLHARFSSAVPASAVRANDSGTIIGGAHHHERAASRRFSIDGQDFGDLAAHSLEALCCKLGCVKFVRDELQKVAGQLEEWWQSLLVTNAAHIDASELSADDLVFPRNKFDARFAHLDQVLEHISVCIAVRIVAVQLKQQWEELYNPLPASTNCLAKTPILDNIEKLMPAVFRLLPESLRDSTARAVFVECTLAFEWVLLESKCAFSRDDTKLISDDIEELIDLFQHVMDGSEAKLLTTRLKQVVIVHMNFETAELIRRYDRPNSDNWLIYSVLQHRRSDAAAQKFAKKYAKLQRRLSM
jgi:Fes/CIP4, and EFC/F-BAR homology domain